MFVVVTVICVWLGWNVNIVRERELLLKSLETDESLSFDPFRTRFSNVTKWNFSVSEISSMKRSGVSIPWFRRMLGDQAVMMLTLPQSMSESDILRFKSAFPEALISQEPANSGFSSGKAKPYKRMSN